MIEKLGLKLGKYFFNKGYIDENDIDAVRYYIEVFFNEYCQLILTLFLGHMINQAEATIVYLIYFVSIRKFSGGYHANSIWMCNLISYALYFSGIFTNILLPISSLLLPSIISVLYLWINGAIYSVDQIEYRFRGSQSKKLRIVLTILIILTISYTNGKYLGLLGIVMVQVVLLDIIKERRIKNGRCKKNCTTYC